ENTFGIGKSVFQPSRHEIEWLWREGSDESVYFKPDQHWLIKVLNPMTLTASFVGVVVLFSLVTSLQQLPYSTLLAAGLIVVIPLIVYGVAKTGNQLVDSAVNWFTKQGEEQSKEPVEASPEEKEKLKKKRRRELQGRYSTLACNGEGDGPDFDSLPEEKRTITLRFQELKRKVCRPFQR
ncbi:MAG: hypothetical protein BRC25_02300, partial [Parcubacteria group bacterium SW_6_46_9]